MAPQRSVASNPIVRYVADALRFYFEFHQQYDGFYGAFIHDPLAVAATLDRTLVADRGHLRRRRDPRRAHDRDDRRRPRGTSPAGPPNLDVATSADVPTFLDRLIERVGGLAADRVNVAR